MDSSSTISRRRLILGLAAAGWSTALLPLGEHEAEGADDELMISRQSAGPGADDVFQGVPMSHDVPPGGLDTCITALALNIESMQAEYYTRGTSGSLLPGKNWDMGMRSLIIGGHKVIFAHPRIEELIHTLALDEIARVRICRRYASSGAGPPLLLDFSGPFRAAGRSARFGSEFDPFADEISFVLGGMLFEEVGARLYQAALPLLGTSRFRSVLADILSMKCRHLATARAVIFEAGAQAREAAQQFLTVCLLSPKDIHPLGEEQFIIHDESTLGPLEGQAAPDQGRALRAAPLDLKQGDSTTPASRGGDRAALGQFKRTLRRMLDLLCLRGGAVRGGFFPLGLRGDFREIL